VQVINPGKVKRLTNRKRSVTARTGRTDRNLQSISGKLLNFTKMDPYEFKTFTDILQRYSYLCKPVKGNGRGKKKK